MRWRQGPFVVCFAAVFAALAGAAAGADDGPYVKKDTWQETMLASREGYHAWLARKHLPRLSSSIEVRGWFIAGPLEAKALGEVALDESKAELRARGADGRRLWREAWDPTDGRVHRLCERGGLVYLFRNLYLREKEPRRVVLSFGSNCPIEVRLNGNKAISNDQPRQAAPDQDKLEVDLKPGHTQILVKLYSPAGGHEFFSAMECGWPAALWERIARDFPAECRWMGLDGEGDKLLAWFHSGEKAEVEKRLLGRVLGELKKAGDAIRKRVQDLEKSGAPTTDRRWLDLYVEACRHRAALDGLRRVDTVALRLAIQDLAATFPDRYTRAGELLARVEACEERMGPFREATAAGQTVPPEQIHSLVEEFTALQREALLANPLMEFDRLLVVKRHDPDLDTKYFRGLGLPNNWQGNCSLPREGHENEIDILSPPRPDGKLTAFYRPFDDECIADIDLHWDAERMLFSMQGAADRRWQVWEIKTAPAGPGKPRQVTRGAEDVDNYDGCYVPDPGGAGERVLYDSSAVMQGIPCVNGGDAVANLFLADADGQGARQLCFDQDHNWCPTVLNDGRIMYTRWEYSDTPHYFTRLLFRMNPDGTQQSEYYGSNSYWPNSLFFARPIPGHPTKIVAIASGHHGNPRMGELVVLDPARGRHEGEGVVHRIPGRGQAYQPIIGDEIVNGVWPKFLHPWPLSDPSTSLGAGPSASLGAGKYFLVSCKPTPLEPWGIYLVDVFDNMVPICVLPGWALMEPVPIVKRPRPPAVPDRVDLAAREGLVYLTDIYLGPGLAGVPRGTVKNLRLFEYHYAYRGMGGHIHVGIDGPWDVHRVLGTVPVEPDGSAVFRVPANTPIAVQPLDANGQAIQLMRSWFTAMPGEVLSCVGCHEPQSESPPVKAALAARREPSAIRPWRGPARGFSFLREVQPVLDGHCVGCHDGRKGPAGQPLPDLRGDQPQGTAGGSKFDASYMALHRYVRRPGPESDYRLLRPYEYHASTSEVVQRLRKGHHGVRLDEEAWDRLITWIDLNVPDHGTWGEHKPIPKEGHERRRELLAKYAGRTGDPEAIANPYQPGAVKFVAPPPQAPPAARLPRVAGWPFDAAEAARRQQAVGLPKETRIELDKAAKLKLALVLVPAGEFVMGSAEGAADERPAAAVRIDRPFYMGKFEITNAQYGLFDAWHDSGVISRFGKDHNSRGVEADKPDQPVIRVTWRRAMAFCRWLSDTTGRKFSLPTEAQWEYACRAGSVAAMSYGGPGDDFSRYANLADASLVLTGGFQSCDWLLKIADVKDGSQCTAAPGRYQPNAWGLCDMHGNVAEWTRSAYRPYPCDSRDGRDDPAAGGTKVVRGGSFYDRPQRATSSFRLHYQPWQGVFNIGFRVVMEADR